MQGRKITSVEVDFIRDLIRKNRDWGRSRLSQELCRCWNWRNAQGRIKDMAARTLLLKLHRSAIIELPPSQHSKPRRYQPHDVSLFKSAKEPVSASLDHLRPLSVNVVAPGSGDGRLFDSLLAHGHYLGHRRSVGENLRYLVRDRHARVLACVLFGSAAWKCADRDTFIGWDRATRERNLQGLTNNTRFLIPEWVEVPHLASHVLGLIVRRIGADWQAKYAHPVHALETFVDRSRFKGTCYRAANWLRLGSTQGRTRGDRDHSIQTSVKDIYLYSLTPRFRQELCVPAYTQTEGRAGR